MKFNLFNANLISSNPESPMLRQEQNKERNKNVFFSFFSGNREKVDEVVCEQKYV